MKYKNNALCVIFKDDRYLMQLRSSDAPVLPGYLGFFGGSIEDPEEPDDAIRREIFEELKYKSTFEFYRIRYSIVINFVEKAYIYINDYDGDFKNIITYEGEKAIWIKLNDVSNYNIMDHDVKLLEEINEYNNKRRIYEQATNN